MFRTPPLPVAGPSRLATMEEELALTQEQRHRMLRSNKKLERVLGNSLPSTCLPLSSRTAGLANQCTPKDGLRRRLQRQRTLPTIPSKPSTSIYSGDFVKSMDIITDAPPVADGCDDERLSELRRPVPPILLPQPAKRSILGADAETASSNSQLAPTSRKSRLRRKSLSIATLDVGHDAGTRLSNAETATTLPDRLSLERSGVLSAPRPLPIPPLPQAAQTVTVQSGEPLRPSRSSSTRSSRHGSIRRLPPTPPVAALTPDSLPLPLTRSSSITSTSTSHSISTSAASVVCDINIAMSTPSSPTSPSSPSSLCQRVDLTSSAEILRMKRSRMAKLMRVLGESPPCHLVFGSENTKHAPSPISEEEEEAYLPHKRKHVLELGELTRSSEDNTVDTHLPSPDKLISPITFAPGVSSDYAIRRPSSLDIQRDPHVPSQVKTQCLVQNACWVRQQIGRNRQFVEVHDYGNVVQALREL